ncbi:MAG TPA: tetratricopeptide repeat protein [Gammaproteobacteria bacterium]|jgi:predicted TPR repeat methyltransferase|nr:tetratricopeptide repeat protein [Gammaproteobacteria bacterium]
MNPTEHNIDNNTVLQSAFELYQAGHREEAKAACLLLLEKQGDESSILHMLGILCAEEGDFDLAKHYLERALVIDPEDPNVTLHLANVLKNKNLLIEAEELLTALINQYPSFVAAYHNLANIYFSQEKWEESVCCYQKAISLQANYTDAYYHLGLAFYKAHRIHDAIHTYRALLELSPAHPGGLFQLGSLLLAQHQYLEAIYYFKILAKEHPFHFETQVNLGNAYWSLRNKEEAKFHYLKALEINENDSQVLFNLGVIAMQQGKLQESQDFYFKALKIDPDMFSAHNNIGVNFLALKNKAAAIDHFREALRIEPSNAAVRHLLAVLTHKEGVHTASPAYLTALFDSYADHYDTHLRKELHYRVPEEMYAILQKQMPCEGMQKTILDLGCGTGLCGEVFKSIAKTLCGVDLSEKMLQIAADKNIYTELVLGQVLSFLCDKQAAYDIVLAADVLVYEGDLSAIFAAVANALLPEGLFIFNTEMTNEKDYIVMDSGRFAHRKAYIEALTVNHGFSVLQYREIDLRVQDGFPVEGHLYLLQKRSN